MNSGQVSPWLWNGSHRRQVPNLSNHPDTQRLSAHRISQPEQAIATGLQTADKERQGLLWAGGGGVLGRGWLSFALFLLRLCLHTSLPTRGLELPGGAALRAEREAG